MKRILLPIILFTGFLSCTQKPVDQTAEAEKIMNLSREWSKAASSNDLEKTLSYWASDAMVLVPGQPTIKGHEEIRKMLQANAAIPGFEVAWEPQEAFVSESGDMGYAIGHNYVSMNDSTGNKITLFNKGVEIWQKQDDGSWKNVVDIFNADPSLTSIK